MKHLRINRRQVLNGVGAVSVLGALGVPTAAFAGGDGEENEGRRKSFHFAALGRPSPSATVAVVMAGDGTFTSSHVRGHGVYTYVNTVSPPPPPNPILSAGTWKATGLVGFTLVGTYGVAASGILTMTVDLVQRTPSPTVIPAAALKVVCNIPFVPFMTGLAEGFYLDAFGQSFAPVGMGITQFSTVNEQSSGHEHEEDR